MKKQTTPKIEALEDALVARVRLLEKAQYSVRRHKERLDQQVKELHELKCQWTPPSVDEFRLVIGSQEPFFWSEESMLNEVVGDHTPDECCGATWQEHYASEKEWADARIAVEDENHRWISAYHGNGVYGWHARLEQRNRVSKKWEEVESCGGFYSTCDMAPEDQIREQLTRDHSEGCEIVYREAGET